MSGPRVVFIHGPAASGKYTIGSALAERLGIPLFHNHLTVDLVTTLFDFGSPPFIALREDIWLAAFTEAARAGVSFVFTFFPEATVRPTFVEEAVAAVEARGGAIVFVELTCSEEAVEARLDSESRARFGKLRSLELYRQLREGGAFDFPPLPEPIVRVATDEVTVGEAVARIERALAGR